MAATHRKFSEEEVHALLRTASARQQEAEAYTKLEAGLSFEEVQRIAEDAGIDPKYVHVALMDLESNEPESKPNAYYGGPTYFRIERFLEGRLDKEFHPEVISQVRKFFPKNTGTYTQLSDLLEWKVSTQSGRVTSLRFEPSGDNTRIVWEERLSNPAILMHLASMMIMFMVLMATISTGNFSMIATTIAALSYAASRFFYKNYVGKTMNSAQENMKQLVAYTNGLVTEPEKTGKSPSTKEPLLDLEEEVPQQTSGVKKQNKSRTS